MKNEINRLMDKILSLSGNKIITLAYQFNEIFKIDIDKNNKIGYIPAHKYLFEAKLANAMRNGGCVIIRQFLALQVKRIAQNGKELWFPEKNIYGVLLGDNCWINMDLQSLRQACETDACTGQLIEKESGVHYKVLPA